MTTTVAALRQTELAQIVSRLANQPQEWMAGVRLDPDRRWHARLELTDDYDVWVLSWLPGQRTGFHDHGESAGAFVVATGALEEHRPGASPLTLQPRRVRAFGAHYVHDVRNTSAGPAISLHVYSPPLTHMAHYALTDGELRPVAVAAEPIRFPASGATGGARLTRLHGIDGLLAGARRRFGRLLPAEAHAAVQDGDTVLVDIRPVAQRVCQGSIPGALIVERNVLEWRFDPTSEARLPLVIGYDVRPVVVCAEGYASSLAAASLQELGLWRATDVIGGFKAWREAGLPVTDVSAVAVPAFETRCEG